MSTDKRARLVQFIEESVYKFTEAETATFIVNEISGRSGIFNVHPHRFRRTFATSMINRGMDIQEVRELLSHSNIETTMEYIYIEDGKVHESYRRYSR